MRRLRIALLVAIVVVIAGVTGLFVLGRASRRAVEVAVAESVAEPVPMPEDDAAVLSEGFDYEQQVAGKPVFRLQGERFTTDRAGTVALEGVRLVLYRDGEPYEIASRTAVYDPDSQDAELEGEVVVSGGDGWRLEGDRLDLLGASNTVVSRGSTVSFRRGESLRGTAQRLRYQIDEQTLALAGTVRIEGAALDDRPPLSLVAESVSWGSEGSSLRALGGVELRSGGDVLRSRRLDARLVEGGGSLETAIALDDVTGRFEAPDGEPLDFTAERARVDFDPATGSPSIAALFGEQRRQKAVLRLGADGPSPRQMAAPVVRVTFVNGKPAEVFATRGIVLRENGEAGSRSAAAEELTATLSVRGELDSAQLRKRVRLSTEEWTVTGDEAALAAGGSTAEVRGRPARATGERGELQAPTLRFDRSQQRLDALSGVRATMRSGVSPLAAGDEQSAGLPVGVEAHEATFLDSPRSFEFRGDVRAAQGESLLFADQLAGNDATASALATGGVRTQWTDRAPIGRGEAPMLTVITSERLEYMRDAGEAHYGGGVLVRQARREISGDDLIVELDDQGSARRMLATGRVRIEDREAGRSVTGSSADYDLAAGQAIITGEPVVLREASGTTLRGRRALFDQRTGSSRLLSDSP